MNGWNSSDRWFSSAPLTGGGNIIAMYQQYSYAELHLDPLPSLTPAREPGKLYQ